MLGREENTIDGKDGSEGSEAGVSLPEKPLIRRSLRWYSLGDTGCMKMVCRCV